MIDVAFEKLDLQQLKILVEICESKTFSNLTSYAKSRVKIVEQFENLKNAAKTVTQQRNVKSIKELMKNIEEFEQTNNQFNFNETKAMIAETLNELELDSKLTESLQTAINQRDKSNLEYHIQNTEEQIKKHPKTLPTEKLSETLKSAKLELEKMTAVYKLKQELDELCANAQLGDKSKIQSIITEIKNSPYSDLVASELGVAKNTIEHLEKMERAVDQLDKLLNGITYDDRSRLGYFISQNESLLPPKELERAKKILDELLKADNKQRKDTKETKPTQKTQANIPKDSNAETEQVSEEEKTKDPKSSKQVPAGEAKPHRSKDSHPIFTLAQETQPSHSIIPSFARKETVSSKNRQVKKVGGHPLLEKLHELLIEMLRNNKSVVVTRVSPYSQNVVTTIRDVLLHNTKVLEKKIQANHYIEKILVARENIV